MVQNTRQTLQEGRITGKEEGRVSGVLSCCLAKFLLFWGCELSAHVISAAYMIMEFMRQARYCQLHCISTQFYNPS